MIWAALYIATIYGANWALKTFDIISPFGLAMPAGVLFAGLAFTLRDQLHEDRGPGWCIGAILIGCALSYVLEDAGRVALASAAAFGLSEVLDLTVYATLRRRSWDGAVLASNACGLVLDSALFLFIAFGSLDFIAGLIVGKVAMTALAWAALKLGRQRCSISAVA